MVHSSPDSRKHREASNIAQLPEHLLGVCKAPGLIPSKTDTGHGDTSVTPVLGRLRGWGRLGRKFQDSHGGRRECAFTSCPVTSIPAP